MAGRVPAISLCGTYSLQKAPDPARSPNEIVESFVTLRDFFRYAVSRFNAAGLAFGHGTDNAVDEAAFLLLETLHLPIDRLDPFLDARLTHDERQRLLTLIERRIAERKPAAYLINRAYIQGRPFFVDERVIVPRSYIGELLFNGLVGEGGLIDDAGAVGSVLDLCTGGGSLAILAAEAFPTARIDAVDLSKDALAVAKRNVEDYEIGDRIFLFQGDLFAPLGDRRYDVILTNPPYVDAEALDAFPQEFAAEPRLAHDGGGDGLDLVRRILAEAGAHLTRRGALICEIGRGRALLERDFPRLPFVWLDTEQSEGEVFALAAGDLGDAPRQSRRSRKPA
jgi:ribosomal protein L3 glutamine methyltransferase